ncbi:TIGR03618 family F420-dependent PPOX class oxidoreductase [Streptomyces sp. NP160]|uniref:TIGR03618 family F420-dependent PPOX class oxidoreductase n=1 Tax=Streptomyces sp. NP160 TaxID=2586637 RepID=UPI0011180DCD|nr:TIGR03618 family F420-dependent PPOX class oxidoreductase [Streptomyces sp. NP160]TNM69639.1 TIGR03618 family F420-dependent PPOX class oxidoreductase [Streptomyces sp. NP160]
MADWDEVVRYFTTDAVVHLATVGKDGGPRSVPVWVDADGEQLVFFTEEGSVKDRNLARDPRLAVSVTAPGNPLSFATVRGEVVERLTGGEAMVLVDSVSTTYTGGPYEVRTGFVAFRVRPTSWSAHDFSEG